MSACPAPRSSPGCAGAVMPAAKSASAAGRRRRAAPFLCRLCIPAASWKSAGSISLGPCPPAASGEEPSPGGGRLSQEQGAGRSPSAQGAAHLPGLCAELRACSWLWVPWDTGCWKKGSEKCQSYGYKRNKAGHEGSFCRGYRGA